MLNILNFELGKKRIFRILELNSKKTKNSKFDLGKLFRIFRISDLNSEYCKNSKNSKKSK
jgi:hypothetical protein